MRAEAVMRSSDRDAARDLADALERTLEGEVLFDEGSRALYAHDLSIYRHVPIGAVIPRSKDDVIATVAACHERGVPIFGRGCGTSLAGQTCNVAVVIDFSKYLNQILELDPQSRTARVQPGVILDQLRDAAEEHNLTFAPDPATHEYCTLGGMIGNNSCGAHSIMGGKTVENLRELEVLTYDGHRMRVGKTPDDEVRRIIEGGGRQGEVYAKLKGLIQRVGDHVRQQYPQIPRRVSGYNLDQLLPENGFHVGRALVGSEGTCAMTLEATVELMASPPKRVLLLIGYPDWASSGYHAPLILEQEPIAVEGISSHLVENMRRKGREPEGRTLLPEGTLWLLVEFGGESDEEASGRAHDALRKLEGTGNTTGMQVFEDPDEQSALWFIRESGVGASRVPGKEDSWPSWEDSAVAVEKLGDYLRDLEALKDRYGYACTLYGHFGHACLHTRFNFELKTKPGVAKFRAFMQEAADLVVSYDGSLSGEHGDGQAKGELLERMYGPTVIEAFSEFKSIWDPDWKMNPGKLVKPYPLDENLRTGPDYQPWQPETHFRFPDDAGSMAQATERCFGVGKCRSLSSAQTMCPSFPVTREERHTTRGRAHLLFEMFRGDALSGGWHNESVKEALDLCLQCKGCKSDCPAQVDMATYKAEFLSHYYEGRRRPRAAFVGGQIHRWAPFASRVAPLANLLTQTPGLSGIASAAAGFRGRRPPRMDGGSFIRWFEKRTGSRAGTGAKRVLLWPDTLNNYFRPGAAQAALEVLERAGYEVVVPRQRLCCGRPLYEFGLLDQAKAQLRAILSALENDLVAGVPVVGLEPSCISVFRDELINLFPEDERARRLSEQSRMLSEFLIEETGYEPPRMSGRAIVHAHCHQKSVLDDQPEVEILRRMGLDAEMLPTGCCGMAGTFGYEHPEVSMAIAERALLPAVRQADKDTLVVASGFSCRQQIEDGTGRRPLHLAEVMARPH